MSSGSPVGTVLRPMTRNRPGRGGVAVHRSSAERRLPVFWPALLLRKGARQVLFKDDGL